MAMNRHIGSTRAQDIPRCSRIAFVLALVMFGLGAVSASAGDPFADLRAERLPQPHPPATLSLPALTGGTVKVPDEYRGKVVLLGFFTTT